MTSSQSLQKDEGLEIRPWLLVLNARCIPLLKFNSVHSISVNYESRVPHATYCIIRTNWNCLSLEKCHGIFYILLKEWTDSQFNDSCERWQNTKNGLPTPTFYSGRFSNWVRFFSCLCTHCGTLWIITHRNVPFNPPCPCRLFCSSKSIPFTCIKFTSFYILSIQVLVKCLQHSDYIWFIVVSVTCSRYQPLSM